jgi:predicted transcriptional regulator
VLGSGNSNLDPILLIVLNYNFKSNLGMALETLGTTGRRDKVTIMGDLLNIMQEPRRLTHILYKSNMSYVQLVKYLDNLIDMGLAEKTIKPHRAYGITTNGKLFMDLVRGNGHNETPSN